MNKKHFSEILKKIGKSSSISNFNLLKGGANNRVYKIDLKNEDSLILKSYFSDNKDKRNRLLSEFSFLSFLWNNNIKCIPEPIYKIDNKNIGIYSYIKAKVFQKTDVCEKYINQAFDFYISINEQKEKALNIMMASEACLSYEDYISSIEKRLHNLSKLHAKAKEDQNALIFLEKDLKAIWHKILSIAIKHKNVFKIPKIDKRISPSDFGFHNILIDENNNLFFIDFEYAGWDDPAKTLCDFFTQPKIPIEQNSFFSNMEKIASSLQSPNDFKRRTEIVFPISQIKWCCILLNSFLAINSKRRNFANAKENKEQQLEKALALLKKIKI